MLTVSLMMHLETAQTFMFRKDRQTEHPYNEVTSSHKEK